MRNLNLNLPPASSSLADLGIISVDPEPVLEPSLPSDNSKKIVESSSQPNTENELKFPINDSLLVGSNGAGSSSAPSSASGSISYPIVDFSGMLPLPSKYSPSEYPPMPISMVPPPPPPVVQDKVLESVDEKSLMEERLLMELEMMGFKKVDLNKEVLRMNDYDLEKSVDDLCGVADWDPILEELQEMVGIKTQFQKP